MKQFISAAALAFTAFAMVPAHATSHSAGGEHAPTAAALSDGEIRKIDQEAKKLTIRHGPLENLGMPAMTMVFQVKDSAMLDTVRTGDRVKFVADKDAGAYVVTRIEIAK
jgi:Cu(I)/Ag(I) efflux system protein CusF